jgi:hypothetical protein
MTNFIAEYYYLSPEYTSFAFLSVENTDAQPGVTFENLI